MYALNAIHHGEIPCLEYHTLVVCAYLVCCVTVQRSYLLLLSGSEATYSLLYCHISLCSPHSISTSLVQLSQISVLICDVFVCSTVTVCHAACTAGSQLVILTYMCVCTFTDGCTYVDLTEHIALDVL